MASRMVWDLSGPMFARGVVGKASKRVMSGLGKVGMKLVVDQMFKPSDFPRSRHGFDSGALRRSVNYKVSGFEVTIASGARDGSSSMHYADKIERRYHMYEKAKKELEQKAPEIIEDVMAGTFNGTSVRSLAGFK